MTNDLLEELQTQKVEWEQGMRYASYIQNALFPGDKELESDFPESFLFFKPRDIISGDFYWLNKDSDKITIAVGDSTGHGVPGALMSVLGISILNLVAAKHKPRTASSFLDIMREYLMNALSQTGNEKELKDGIDISLCIIDKKANRLQFAGAFNPLYIVRDDKLIQLEGDKMPIGIAAEFEFPFSNVEFELQKNDYIFLFSDGFPDQFGGPDGKKYKYRRFRKLITDITKFSSTEQLTFLKKELNDWKGNYSQIDDITILGVKYI